MKNSTESALVRRINRVLKPNGQWLRKALPSRFQCDTGDYRIIDISTNCVLAKYVDLKTLTTDLGA